MYWLNKKFNKKSNFEFHLFVSSAKALLILQGSTWLERLVKKGSLKYSKSPTLHCFA